jgi:hypothetical protein
MSATVRRVRAALFLLTNPKRVLAIVVSTVGALLYVWFAAVRAVPGVKGRKAALRATRARRRSV